MDDYINSIINQKNIDNGRLELVEEIFNSIESSNKYYEEFQKIYTEHNIEFCNFKSNVNHIIKNIIDEKDEMIPENIIQNIKNIYDQDDIKSFILKIKYIILYMIYIVTTKKFKNENDYVINSMFTEYSINRILIGFYFLLLGQKQFFTKFFSKIDIKSKKEKEIDDLSDKVNLMSINDKQIKEETINDKQIKEETINDKQIKEETINNEKDLIKSYKFNYIFKFDEIKYLSNMSIFVNSIYRPYHDAMPTYNDNIFDYFYDFINSFNKMKNVFIF